MTATERQREMKKQEYLALRQFVRLAESGDGHSAAARLNAAIERELTPRQRQLVRMYYIDQTPMQAIADQLGLDISTVSRTIKRGRGKLKKYMRYGGRALIGSLRS